MKNLLTSLLILIAITLLGQNNFDNIVVVEGKAAISVFPENVAFFIEIDSRNIDYDKCSESALEKINLIKEELEKLNIDKDLLKTSTFRIRKEEKVNRETDEREFVGYATNVSLSLTLKSTHSEIDRVYDLMTKHLKSEFDLRFQLSDQQMENAKEELIKLAISDAKSKAQVISSETGSSLGKVVKIQYGEPRVISNFTYPGFELLFRSMSGYSAARAASPLMGSLTPNDIEIKTNIVIGWELISE